MNELDRAMIVERLRRMERAVDGLASAVRRLGRVDRDEGWSLERIGIAVAIAVGIGSMVATAVAAVYAGQQAELSRQALGANERNAAFLKHVEAMSAYCDALDFSGGRAEMTWSFVRQPEKYQVIVSYKDIGNQFQQPSPLGLAHTRLHELEASTIALRIWLDLDKVEFIERTVHNLKGQFVGAFGPGVKLPVPARKYIETAGNCIGVREVLMAWYREPEVWRLESASAGVSIKLAARPLF